MLTLFVCPADYGSILFHYSYPDFLHHQSEAVNRQDEDVDDDEGQIDRNRSKGDQNCNTHPKKLQNCGYKYYVEILGGVSCPWCCGCGSLFAKNKEGGYGYGCNLLSEIKCETSTPKYAAWSPCTRNYLTELLIHLRSFHREFDYTMLADIHGNLHIIVCKRKQPIKTEIGEHTNERKKLKRRKICEDDPIINSESKANIFAFVGSDNNFASRYRGKDMLRKYARQYIDEIPIIASLQYSHDVQPFEDEECVDVNVVASNRALDNGDQYGGCKEVNQGDAFDLLSSNSTGSQVENGDESANSCNSQESNISMTEIKNDNKIMRSKSLGGRVYFTAEGQLEKDINRYHQVDGAVNSAWMTDQTNRAIGEYLDVNINEKVFMCKWNEHITSCPVYADLWMSNVCELFARRYANYLLQHGLRYVFLLHLITLWDHSLLSFDNVETCIGIVDSVYEQSSSDCDSRSREKTHGKRKFAKL